MARKPTSECSDCITWTKRDGCTHKAEWGNEPLIINSKCLSQVTAQEAERILSGREK